ncbi:condensation domain-containing protein [Kribbella sp. NBC_01505]|uniref:condensation domain-containing protein n=1 Tax=Kribbella sp. NBC_01505 TaxID=2903580 RepID=UPI003863DE1E
MAVDDPGSTQQVRLSFEGLPQRSAPLSWSQLYMWDFLSRMRPHDGQYTVCLETEVGQPVAVDDGLRIVGELIADHEALRTSYRPDETGLPRQYVAGNGQSDVYVLQESAADAWLAAQRERRFGTSGPPVDFALVQAGGTISRVAVIASHLAVDGWSAAVLRRQLRKRLAGRSCRTQEATVQPVDQSDWEATPAGQEANQAGLELWRRTIAEVPPGQLSPAALDSRPRYRQARVSSYAAGSALLGLARRHRTVPSAVLLAAYSQAVATTLGQRHPAFWVVVHNRFAPELQESVGCYFRETLVCLDTETRRTGDQITAAASALLQAFRRSHTNPRQVTELLLDHDRASYFDVARAFYYNFTVRSGAAGPPVEQPDPEWVGAKEFDGQVMHLNADLKGDQLTIRLMADTWCVPAQQIERILSSCLDYLRAG